MTPKPKIQYIGQFYVHGSEARALETQQEKRRAKTRLPQARAEKVHNVYVDPVAMVAILVAVVMLAVMVLGVLQIQQDWEEYRMVSERVEQLRQTNVSKLKNYRESRNLEEIRTKALSMGLVPKAEVETVSVAITMPVPEPQPSVAEELLWFWKGLWA